MKRAIAIAFLGTTMLAGCVVSVGGNRSAIFVPSTAKLLSYGGDPQPAAMQVAGTYYVYDEYDRRVVYAKYVNDGTGLKGFSPVGHVYCVYFLADTTTRPATQPAVTLR